MSFIRPHIKPYGCDVSAVCFISWGEQVIFLRRRVRVEMDCRSTTSIFKELLQLASPSSIIWVLSDTHGWPPGRQKGKPRRVRRDSRGFSLVALPDGFSSDSLFDKPQYGRGQS